MRDARTIAPTVRRGPERDTKGPDNRMDVGGYSTDERLARLETHFLHTATKAWVLGGVVGGMVAAATLTIAIIKLFAM